VEILETALVVLVALLHLYFLVLEMFLWDRPTGLRVFGLQPDFARASRSLAMNQGLYNGFLVAGLVWGLLRPSQEITVLFLVFVIVAGVFGAATVNRRIFWVQAFPALMALALVLRSSFSAPLSSP
jgi:putative membrane protein